MGQVGDGDNISVWFKELPMMTKYLCAATLAATVSVSLHIFDQSTFYFSLELIREKFHFWRLFFPFIYCGPFSFPFAMHMYMLYSNSSRYEKNPYNTGAGGNSADFLWMVLLGMVVMLTIGYYFMIPVLATPLVYMIMYVWSRREPDMPMSLFTFNYKALYSPWVMVAIQIVTGNSITEPLMGIATGHLYFFLVTILPESHGFDLIKTPDFCIKALRMYTGTSVPVGRPFTATAPTPASGGARAGAGGAATGTPFPNLGAGHQWGTGRSLGST